MKAKELYKKIHELVKAKEALEASINLRANRAGEVLASVKALKTAVKVLDEHLADIMDSEVELVEDEGDDGCDDGENVNERGNVNVTSNGGNTMPPFMY